MRLLFIFLLLPVKLFSQDIAGVWVGTIYNDTTRKYIPYEIAITESKGKFSGFSHTIFAGENNRQETGVKSLKIKQRSDKILIEDDALIYNNYAEPAPKGVRQYSVLNVVQADSGLFLIGVFNTNRTKEYSSLTGSIRLRKKEKIQETRIIPRLEEMNLFNSLSFAQSPKNDVAVSPAAKTERAATGREQQKSKGQLPAAAKDSQPVAMQDHQKNTNITTPVLPAPTIKEVQQPSLMTIETDTIGYSVDVVEPANIQRNKRKSADVAKTPEDKKNNPVKKENKVQPVLAQNHSAALNTDTKNKSPESIKKDTVIVAAKDEKTPTPLIQLKKSAPVVADTKSSVAANLKKELAVVDIKDKKISPPALQQKQPATMVTDNKKGSVQTTNKEVVMAPVKEQRSLPPPQQKIMEAAVIPAIVTRPAIQPVPGAKQEIKNPTVLQLPKEKVKEEIKIPVSSSSINLTPPAPVITAEQLAKRKIETIRSVDFTSDSLVLTLYDNGEVDGDTVSVILNGKTIMSKQRLTEKANSKTIYITPDLGDSLQLIMFAENLGSIPPNTGLLIIQDGQERYQIRFEGDLRKNAAITLRRKTK